MGKKFIALYDEIINKYDISPLAKTTIIKEQVESESKNKFQELIKKYEGKDDQFDTWLVCVDYIIEQTKQSNVPEQFTNEQFVTLYELVDQKALDLIIKYGELIINGDITIDTEEVPQDLIDELSIEQNDNQDQQGEEQ